MTNKHRIIVSAENNPYMAWQCKLFHYSCVSRLNCTPIIFVHGSSRRWQADFLDVVRAGGIVRSAPSYGTTRHGTSYPPRNTPGTLLHAAETCDGRDEFFVLCDPDMIFVREPAFPETLAAECCSYLNFDQPDVQTAARRVGVPLDRRVEQKENSCCAVPHVIPATDARRLAELWLEAIDAFTSELWEVSMYAFGLAVTKLELDVTPTHMVVLNRFPQAAPEADVIHYCYGDDTWSKRHYWTEEHLQRVWEPPIEAPRETILGEILLQIAEARDFYRRFYF